MTKGWTEERRKKQAERIRQTRPWEKSTGPKTIKGKRRSSLNALKHGLEARDTRALRRALKLNREFVKEVKIWTLHFYAENKLKEMIMKSKRIPSPLPEIPKQTEDANVTLATPAPYTHIENHTAEEIL